jgi:hypothetical protein
MLLRLDAVAKAAHAIAGAPAAEHDALLACLGSR